MPVITAISQQRRRSDRFSIYVDGSYRFSLGQNQLVDAGLRIGDELADADLQALEQRSEEGKALDRAYSYLALRPRSRREMVQYFRRKDYPEEMATRLIQQLENQDLLNDQRFAQAWVEDRQALSPRSRLQLQSELRAKGVGNEVIEVVLASAPQDDSATLQQLISTRQLRRRYPDTQKLTRYLVSKGFPYSAVTKALQQSDDEDS